MRRRHREPAKTLLKPPPGKPGKLSLTVRAHGRHTEDRNLAAPLVDAAEVADLQKRGHH